MEADHSRPFQDSRESSGLRVGCDVGGTFTDTVAFDGTMLHCVKRPSTPPDFQGGILETLKALPWGRIDMVHGSTVATNALLTRFGEPAALVTNAGFTDVLEIARQDRPDLYALHPAKPDPITPRVHCHGLDCRIAADGAVLRELTDDECNRVVAAIKQSGLQSVAVCLLFSFVDPTHERRFAEIARNAGLDVTLSSDVLPEFREYERATTTAINAQLGPVVRRYLDGLSQELPHHVDDCRVLHGGGGTVPIADAHLHAARLVLSGPAGGVAAAAYIAARHGHRDCVAYDMGGTSTDVTLITDGKPTLTTEHHVAGLPIALPMYDIHTIGAGGGSIAYRDVGGALRVGPKSAGAFPGPACYHHGGVLPTVTDANVYLGRIPADTKLGGTMELHPPLAEKVIDQLADELGLSSTETALGICRIAEAHMSRAIRAVTAARSVDPRGLALVSFGGAGGLHACGLAESLGMSTVLVPPMAGVLSALGMLVTPRVAERSRTVLHLKDVLDDDRLYAEFGTLNADAMDELPAEQTATIEASAEVRYVGQSHTVPIVVKTPTIDAVAAEFSRRYAERFGKALDRAIEVVTLRLRRVGPVLEVALAKPTEDLRRDEVDVEGQAVPRLNRTAADGVDGPALIVDNEATIWVPRGWHITLLDDGTLRVTQ
ncbi:MAG: hydantoinase/oxoprolinase family protein [Planctomycetota bacterium]